jgi:hypothetical protein
VHNASLGHVEEVASFEEYSRALEPHLLLDCIHRERKERTLREGHRLDRERKIFILTSTARSTQPRRLCCSSRCHCCSTRLDNNEE